MIGVSIIVAIIGFALCFLAVFAGYDYPENIIMFWVGTALMAVGVTSAVIWWLA